MPHTRDHWRDRHIFDRCIPGHQIQAHQVAYKEHCIYDN